jgi:hypothetical protein
LPDIQLTSAEAYEPILGWYRQLDDRRRVVLARRTLVLRGGAKLDELGRELGITRERVRQLEGGLLVDLDRKATALNWERAAWRAHSLALAAGLACPAHDPAIEARFEGIDGLPSDEQIVVRGVLWRMAGGYQLSRRRLNDPRSGSAREPAAYRVRRSTRNQQSLRLQRRCSGTVSRARSRWSKLVIAGGLGGGGYAALGTSTYSTVDEGVESHRRRVPASAVSRMHANRASSDACIHRTSVP